MPPKSIINKKPAGVKRSRIRSGTISVYFNKGEPNVNINSDE